MSDTGRETYLAMHETYHRSLRAERLSDYLQFHLDRNLKGLRPTYAELMLGQDDLEFLIKLLREHI